MQAPLEDPGRRGQRVHVRVHRVPMFIRFTIKSDYISLHGDDDVALPHLGPGSLLSWITRMVVVGGVVAAGGTSFGW